MKQAGLVLALCLCSSSAFASLSAGIPAECGSASELETELRQRLGRDDALDSTHITVTPEGSGYLLVVLVGSERRELHDQSCQELLRAAVVISLALLDPKQHEEVAPEAAQTPLAEPPSAKPATPSTLRVALALGAGLHVGTTPRPTLLLDLDAQLRWSHFGIAAGLRYLAPTSETDSEGHGARVSGAGAYAAGTFEPWPRVQGRLGLVGYRLFGTGLGSVQPTHDAVWEVAPTLCVSFIPYQRPPFWTSIGAEGQLNLLRPHFDILHYDSVFRVPSLSASAFARAGVVW